ncbi:MAG: diacylglycerol/lipid kinase family protein [Aridibacter sp.]
MPSPIKVIINRGSGSNEYTDELETELTELFAANGLNAEIFAAESGEDILKFAENAVKSDAEIIVAGGGDGTMNAVVSKIIKTEKTLGILPLGTLNHFSKDLNIPQNLPEAVRVIAENHTRKIDAGEVNGHIFVNNSSIGLYPHIVRVREEQQEKLGRGKWSAAFWAALKILQQHPFLSIKLANEKGEHIVKTPFVFVGNNKYEMDFFNVGRRKRLDEGKLSVYFLHKSGRRGLFALALRMIFGLLRQAKDFEEIQVKEIKIETHAKQMLVAFDGEVETLEMPLCYKIHPLALSVIVPRDEI